MPEGLFDHLEDTQDLAWHIDATDRDPRSEAKRCQAALRMARIICPGVDIVAVPNAGRRSQWEVNQRHREGMKAGALDWVLTWHGCGIAFAEWKNGTDMPDANQRDRLNMLTRFGHHCGVFRQEDSFFRWLRRLDAPFVGRIAA